jgi:hypothetical protein
MKQLNVCLILCITLFTASNAFQFSSLLEVQQLKSSIFGSNLIETIALTFQTEDKVSAAKEVLTMLEELSSQLSSDQSSDTEKFTTKTEEFDSHINQLAEEIAALTERINYLASEIERLNALITQADANIASFAERIVNLEALLQEMALANLNDNKYYEEKISSLGKLYNTFTTILERLDKLTGSVSAVNVPTHINLTDAEKRDLEWKNENPNVESNLDKSFLQVESETVSNMVMQMTQDYNSFLESTLNADQGALKKLVSILSSIQEDILNQKLSTVKHLNNINEKYQEMKTSAEAEIEANKAAKKSQEENRLRYIAERDQNMEEKANKEKRRELLETEKSLNESLRDQLKATFQKEKSERAAEVEVVNTLIRIVENRLVQRSF